MQSAEERAEPVSKASTTKEAPPKQGSGQKSSTKGVQPCPQGSDAVVVWVRRKDNKEKLADIQVRLIGPDSFEKKEKSKAPNGTASWASVPSAAYAANVELTGEDAAYFKKLDADVPLAKKSTGAFAVHSGAIELEVAPIRLFLELSYKDPEGKPRPFPKDFPFELVYLNEDGSEAGKEEVKLGEKGLIVDKEGKPGFEIDRAKKQFTVRFTQKKKAFVVVEKRGEAKQSAAFVEADDPHASSGPLFDLLKDGGRCFQLPQGEWTCANSTWAIEEAKNAVKKDEALEKFEKIDEKANAVMGTEEKPIKLILEPGWKHLRWVYYDRWIKGAERISIPAVMVESIADKTVGNEASATSAARWEIGDDDKKAVQAVPWIIIADKAKPKPDDKSLYRFKTGDHTYIETAADKSARKLVSGTERNTPNADRLRFYDLPKLWRSHTYYGRLSGGGSADEADLAEKLIAKPTTKDRVLTFSLDDLVLTKEDLSPVAWTAGDRVGLFHHRFSNKDADGGNVANVTAEGLFKPDTAAKKSYFSKLEMTGDHARNYFFDYPNWTRLAAYKGNLYEAFASRVNQGGTPDLAMVTGARAAVRSIDATDAFPGIKAWDWATSAEAADGKPTPNRFLADASWNSKRPDRIDRPFFSIQPFYEQHTGTRYSKPYADGNWESGGRFDMALLRCCDAEKSSGATDPDTEYAVNFHYFRMFFTFVTNPAIGQESYKERILSAINARWNGGDAVNSKRAELAPQAAEKVRVPIVWAAQCVDRDHAHFDVKVEDSADGRDNRGRDGTGLSQTTSYQSGANNFFAAAHETGHMDSLPDEYCERWDGASYGQLSYKCNLPGDPFEPDGRTVEFDDANSPMMNGNQTIRNRYYWHCAEFARLATGVKFKVVYDTFKDFKLPPHTNVWRTYAWWPIEGKVNHEPAAVAPLTANRGKFDMFLYCMGEDRWAKTLLPAKDVAGPKNVKYDGVLVLFVKLKIKMPASGTGSSDNDRKDILQRFAGAARKFNHRFYLKGKVKAGTDQEWSFDRCLIHFSPRFLVENHSNNTLVTEIETNLGSHFEVRVRRMGGADTLYSDWTCAPAAAEIQKDTDWEASANGINVNAGAVKAKITAYHAVARPLLAERLTKLDEIVAACGTAETGADVLTVGDWNTANTGLTADGQLSSDIAAYHGKAKDKFDERQALLDGMLNRCNTLLNEIAVLPADNQWVIDTTGVAERNRTSGNIQPVDNALQAYNAIADKARLSDRINALDTLEKACDTCVQKTEALYRIAHPFEYWRLPKVKQLRTDAQNKIRELRPMAPVKRLKDTVEPRKKAVDLLKTLVDACKAMKAHVNASAGCRKLEIQFKSPIGPSLDDEFEKFFLSFFGINKLRAGLTAADLKPFLNDLNFSAAPAKDVHAIA